MKLIVQIHIHSDIHTFATFYRYSHKIHSLSQSALQLSLPIIMFICGNLSSINIIEQILINITQLILYRDMQGSSANVQTADQFLKICDKFKLGDLITEQRHPKSIGLSSMAQNDIVKAINCIKEIDIETIQIIHSKIDDIQRLYRAINQTFLSNGRVFITGCGATGRLSVLLETLWRHELDQIIEKHPQQSKKYSRIKQQFIAFMAGGDAAIVKSVQDFQDHPEFGEQQLMELGFSENDLLVGGTSGGSSHWVIGAIWKAAEVSKRKPFFLFGNPEQNLIQHVQRSKQMILSDKVNKLNCNVGPMALTGSTRMQSGTILMYVLGLTLFGCDDIRRLKTERTWKQYADDNLTKFIQYMKTHDFSGLSKIVQFQSQLYKEGKQITYQAGSQYAMSILTDTTERSPTFSLAPFPNRFDLSPGKCWCNLKILHDQNPQLIVEQQSKKDWHAMLGKREIRGLDSPYWKKFQSKVSSKQILGFTLHKAEQNVLTISNTLKLLVQNSEISFELQQFSEQPCRLSKHILLKIILNTLSTVIMGRLQRYKSNIMTYVQPTNYKLIDRSARNIQSLMRQQDKWQAKYEDIVKAIFEFMGKIKEDEAIVIKVIEYLKQNKIGNRIEG